MSSNMASKSGTKSIQASIIVEVKNGRYPFKDRDGRTIISTRTMPRQEMYYKIRDDILKGSTLTGSLSGRDDEIASLTPAEKSKALSDIKQSLQQPEPNDEPPSSSKKEDKGGKPEGSRGPSAVQTSQKRSTSQVPTSRAQTPQPSAPPTRTMNTAAMKSMNVNTEFKKPTLARTASVRKASEKANLTLSPPDKPESKRPTSPLATKPISIASPSVRSPSGKLVTKTATPVKPVSTVSTATKAPSVPHQISAIKIRIPTRTAVSYKYSSAVPGALNPVPEKSTAGAVRTSSPGPNQGKSLMDASMMKIGGQSIAVAKSMNGGDVLMTGKKSVAPGSGAGEGDKVHTGVPKGWFAQGTGAGLKTRGKPAAVAEKTAKKGPTSLMDN